MQANTINMAQALLDQGREFWEQDRYDQAMRVLSHLLGLRELPPKIAERAQFYLGDIQLGQGHYSKARRHLAAALATGTDCGETHFLMACAIDWDDQPDPPRAYYHYRRAVELEPGQPLYSSAYALMKIRRKTSSKYDRESLRRLRDAFSASPTDPDVVFNYVNGLMEMDRHDEAEVALRRARKRWPDHPAFEGLWFDFLRDRGVLPRSAGAARGVPRLRIFTDDEPVILKLPQPAPTAAPSRPLSTRVGLKKALATLPDEQIVALARRLELPGQNSSAQMRQYVARTLLDPQSLQSLCTKLSPGSRHLIQVLANSGGRAGVKELRLDGAAEPRGPHFARRRAAARPLDELREFGLVFLTPASDQHDEPDHVMIPADLRKRLREVLAAHSS